MLTAAISKPSSSGRRARQQGLLDGPGLAHLAGQGLLAQLQADGGADGLQQDQQVVLAAVVADAQAQDVGGVAADEDGRRIQCR